MNVSSLSVLLVASLTAALPASATPPPSLHGGGEGFLSELLGEWIHRTHTPADVRYDYRASKAAVDQIRQGRSFLAGIELPLAEGELRTATGQPLVALPVSVGGVVPIYNLPLPDLRFSGPTLAGIVLGTITRWNAPQIAADNPGRTLPDRAIIVVLPPDDDASTHHLVAFLKAASREFAQARVGSTSPWPPSPAVRVDAHGDREAVCVAVKDRFGSIGFAEVAFAGLYRPALQWGAVQNRSGRFVAATSATLTAAASGVKEGTENGSLLGAEGADAYPLAHYNEILVTAASRDPAKDGLVKAFASWTLDGGQQVAATYGFAPLPESTRSSTQGLVARLPGAARVTSAPVRVHFKRGDSAALFPVEFPAAEPNRLATESYVLHAEAGQELTADLCLPKDETHVALHFTCPDGGDVHSTLGTLRLTAPETGDYRLEVTRSGAAPLPRCQLLLNAVPIQHRVTPSYAGIYHRGSADLEVKVLGAQRVHFDFTDARESGQTGEAEGEIRLHNGVGDYRQGQCHLRLHFGAPGTGVVRVEQLDARGCAFGAAISASGRYALCGGNEADTSDDANSSDDPDQK